MCKYLHILYEKLETGIIAISIKKNKKNKKKCSPHLLNVIHDSFMTPLDWGLPGEHHIALGSLCHHNISGFSRDNAH